jgi:hypothetical protein
MTVAKTETKAKGVITIYIYEDKPIESTFVGDIKGWDISQAIRGLMRGYRKWKAELAKETTKLTTVTEGGK